MCNRHSRSYLADITSASSKIASAPIALQSSRSSCSSLRSSAGARGRALGRVREPENADSFHMFLQRLEECHNAKTCSRLTNVLRAPSLLLCS